MSILGTKLAKITCTVIQLEGCIEFAMTFLYFVCLNKISHSNATSDTNQFSPLPNKANATFS